jgi:hypothetical protein
VKQDGEDFQAAVWPRRYGWGGFLAWGTKGSGWHRVNGILCEAPASASSTAQSRPSAAGGPCRLGWARAVQLANLLQSAAQGAMHRQRQNLFPPPTRSLAPTLYWRALLFSSCLHAIGTGRLPDVTPLMLNCCVSPTAALLLPHHTTLTCCAS